MNNSGVTMWEQRWHPLREEWVVVAAHRHDRPWHGERAAGIRRPARQLTSRTAISVQGIDA